MVNKDVYIIVVVMHERSQDFFKRVRGDFPIGCAVVGTKMESFFQ